MTGTNILDVFLGQHKIAELHFLNDQLHWKYTQEWLLRGFPISPNLPFNKDISSLNTQIFLRNMLPEGHAFDAILTFFSISRNNTFALIRLLGQDMPGALLMIPHHCALPIKPVFNVLNIADLENRLNQRDDFSLFIWDGKPRISTTGVQDKLNVIMDEHQVLGFGDGKLCSTHILKFEKHSLAHLTLNEYVTMQLAKACGINVAEVRITHFGKNPTLLVKRFDRKFISKSEVLRRHIIDGCQALNLPPEYKYERNLGNTRDVAHVRDGASYKQLFDFADKCIMPALTKQKILEWALFNILVFNFDAHGKNISFFVDEAGIQLAPFYDLININMYPNFSQEMAMAIGDEFDANAINSYQIVDFAKTCNLPQALVADRFADMIKQIQIAMPNIISSLELNKTEKLFLNRYSTMINEHCEHFLKKISDIQSLII